MQTAVPWHKMQTLVCPLKYTCTIHTYSSTIELVCVCVCVFRCRLEVNSKQKTLRKWFNPKTPTTKSTSSTSPPPEKKVKAEP